MNKLKITVITVMALVMTAGLCGCTTFDNFKAAFIDKNQDSGSEVIIGVLEPVTGSESKNAEDEIRGIQLANSVHPKAGDYRVSLVFSDNKSDIDATETAAQTLISKDPAIILGSYGSVYSLSASPYIRDAGIPAISITNTNPLVTRNNEYYYRVCYVDSNQGELLGRYVVEGKKENKAGVLLPEGDDAAQAMAASFGSRMRAETDNDDAIAFYEQYKTGQKDFTEELNRINKTGVKSVLLPGEYADAANIITQAAKMDMDVEFLGDTTWSNSSFRKLLGHNVTSEDYAFVQFFSSEGELTSQAITKERELFLEAYQKEYGKDSEPSDAMALGYDAYVIAVDAISRAEGEPDAGTVAEVLADPGYQVEGATGLINFNSIGDPIKTAYITKWRNNKTETIYTLEAQE
ncbi:MAG: ABC transporter substrate-binding protein [Lentihominibacter sp.]